MKRTLLLLLSLFLLFTAVNIVGCKSKEKASESGEKYLVQFYINNEKVLEKEVEKGQKTTPPTYSHYDSQLGMITVEGWYLDQEFTQKFDVDNTPITKNLILYAKLEQENPYMTVDELLAKVEQNATTAQPNYKVTSIKGKVNNGETFIVPEEGFIITDGKITINGKEIRVNYDKTYFNEFFYNNEKAFSKKTIVYNTSGNFITIDVEYIKNNRIYREKYVLNSDNYVTRIEIVDKTDSENLVRDYNLGSIEYRKI